MLELLEMERGEYSILCRFKNCDNNFIWVFFGVYGPISKLEREALWSELGDIRGLWNDPWCVGGHFNVASLPNKSKNCLRMSTTMRHFSKVINEL